MNCPNCGGHIGRFELAPDCKHCGVNLFFSQQEGFLSADAKRCELETASFRIIAVKLKTAFIQWPLPLLKLIFSLGGIAVIVIPFATIQFTLPMFENSISFWAYGLYQSFDDGTLLALFDFAKVEATAPIAAAVLAVLVCMLLVLLAGIALIAAEALSFLNIQKYTRAMIPLSIIGMAASTAAMICPLVLSARTDAYLTVKTGPGAFVALLVFAAVLVLSTLVVKKNIQPEIPEVDLRRVALNKQVRSGEVSLDCLPLPVFETQQEREARMKLLEEAEEEEQANA